MEILDNALNDGAIAAPICVPEGKELRQETHGRGNKDDRGERRYNDSDEPIYLLAPYEPKQKSPDENKRHRVQNGIPREGFESDLKYSLIMHSDIEFTTLWCRPRLVGKQDNRAVSRSIQLTDIPCHQRRSARNTCLLAMQSRASSLALGSSCRS
jgi:hypothetical protein